LPERLRKRARLYGNSRPDHGRLPFDMLALPKLLAAFIVAVVAPRHIESRHPDAVAIFECKFDPPWDVNFDNWPDNWRRTLGPGLPHYIAAAIEADPVDAKNTCLAVHIDGGGIHVESPLATVSDNFSYQAECRLLVSGVKQTRAQLRVEFVDDANTVLQTDTTEWVGDTGRTGWMPLRIGPVNPRDPRITAARIVLHVEPGARVDLSGLVALDDVWLARLPKMTVTTGSPCNVYTRMEDVEVTCQLSGILDSDPDILFELLDASSELLDNSRMQLEGKLITERRSKASEFVGVAENQRAAYAGATSWRPPVTKHGFYKVRVTMQNSRGMMDKRVVNFVLVPPLEQLERSSQGEFGWSLAGDRVPMSLDDLGQLLPLVAVNWVKMPVWYGESEAKRGDDLVMFAERASAKNIEFVGVVDRPPPESELAKRIAEDASIADILTSDTSGWLPLLDPVLARLALRVRWWQLGDDHDASLGRLGNLEPAMAVLREKLFRFGQEVNLGFGWKWIQSPRDMSRPPWEFQQYTASPPLTGDELESYLSVPGRKQVSRWVLIEPLSRSEYDLETRARDLVEQMLAAKINGADAIFAARPFDPDTGLMTEEGMPGELLLPWRTTASLLSGAKYLGSTQLPRHSHNRLLETPGGEVLMVVWSDEPTEEYIQLGDDVRVVDVWGRQQAPRKDGNRQVVDVAAMPKFVLGINSSIARWGMDVGFAQRHVPSVFGMAHGNEIEFRNTFGQGVGGTLEIVGPNKWQIAPQRIDFKLAAGETVSKPFEIMLPPIAASGVAPIRIDFTVDADQTYQFSIDRELVVGDGQVDIETTTRLDEDGSLVIEQRMVNHSTKLVDFKCLLHVQGRRRQRMQVFRLGSSPDTKVYRFPNGAELLGTTVWLRAEEVNGVRVLNHQFVVEQ
jgi:hypothetical protein